MVQAEVRAAEEEKRPAAAGQMGHQGSEKQTEKSNSSGPKLARTKMTVPGSGS